MKLIVNKALISFIVLVLAMSAYFVQRDSTDYLFQSPSVAKLGTFVTIYIRGDNPAQCNKAYVKALKAIDRVNELMSTYDDQSELSRANKLAKTEAVAISDQTYYVLKTAKELGELTDGALDITIVRLIELWKKAETDGILPGDDQLKSAKSKAGLEHLILNQEPRAVGYAADLQVNVDALAKGYAVDMALQAIKDVGVKAALVEIGGEIACFGDFKEQGWTVGVYNPFADDVNHPLSRDAKWKLSIKDEAVATSGDYRQFMEIAGVRYSHIIDPRTGMPVKNIPSVTVIASDCMRADALATAISVLGPEPGLKLIESLPYTECFIVTGIKDDYQVYQSSGFNSHLLD